MSGCVVMSVASTVGGTVPGQVLAARLNLVERKESRTRGSLWACVCVCLCGVLNKCFCISALLLNYQLLRLEQWAVGTGADHISGASQELETPGSASTGLFTRLQMLLHNNVQPVELLVKPS